jgi:glutathione S-transferase
MIALYAAGTSNGMRARMALEECGLAYKFHPVALEKGENRTPQFLALNPNGQIPVIVDHDGPGGKPITLSQSSAILLYCAEKSGKLMPRDGAALKDADVSLYAGWVRLKATVAEVCEGVPNIERWAKEMAARPAMQRATRF